MATDFRRFSDEVEEIAARWHGQARMGEDWQPTAELAARGRTAFNSGMKTDGQGNTAFAKFKGRLETPMESEAIMGLANEKIAADLGYELGVPVAPGTLWQPPGAALAGQDPNRIAYLSLNPFGKEGGGPANFMLEDWRRETGMDKIAANRDVVGRVGTQSSALWVYHAFI
ncbi:MAG: hypothetical protein AAF556_13085, partial [Pseudomonadota bacterium]